MMQFVGINSFVYAISVENIFIGENIMMAINANLRKHRFYT